MKTLINYMNFWTVILLPFVMVQLQKGDFVTLGAVSTLTLFIKLQSIKYNRVKRKVNLF